MAAPKMFDLDGTVAIVTGGNGGIGRGIALGLAEAGAAVAILARNGEKNRAVAAELEALGVRAIGAQGRPRAIARSSSPHFERVERDFGRGQYPGQQRRNRRDARRRSSLEPADWDSVIETNLTSCFILSRLAAQSMVARKAGNTIGKIINVASEYAFFGAPAVPSYSAAKGGLMQLTKSMAIELARAQYSGQCDRARMDRNRDDRAAEVRPALRRNSDAHARAAFRPARGMRRRCGLSRLARVRLRDRLGGVRRRRLPHSLTEAPGALSPGVRSNIIGVMSRRNLRASQHPAGAHLRLPPLKPLRVLAAGEVILDRYLWGDVSRISPEAPIPVLQVHRREEKPGNAGFVMANLRALGATVTALSVVGADRNGTMLREIFRDLGIDTTSILTDPDRPTIVKERMLGSVQSANRATQQLLRVDDEDPRPLEPKLERAFRRRLKQELKRADGVLVSDINKGLMTPAILRDLIEGSRARKIPIVIDPRMTKDFSIYQGRHRDHAQSLRERAGHRNPADRSRRLARSGRDDG